MPVWLWCGLRQRLCFFYGWWNPPYLLLLLGSIAFNYVVALRLSLSSRPRLLLAFGIAANLGLLGLFKYAGFFEETARPIFGVISSAQGILLPLAISFFTFQQIAYLADSIEAEPVNWISGVIACSCVFSHRSSSATVKYFPS